MSVEAPERIWAASVTDSYGEWQTVKDGLPRPVEYVRADKLAELAAEVERWQEAAKDWFDLACGQQEARRIAETALAEKDKEIDWQRLCDVINAANRVSARTGKEHVTDANELREFALARNAGGNDDR